jgi:hypothetical protein
MSPPRQGLNCYSLLWTVGGGYSFILNVSSTIIFYNCLILVQENVICGKLQENLITDVILMDVVIVPFNLDSVGEVSIRVVVVDVTIVTDVRQQNTTIIEILYSIKDIIMMDHVISALDINPPGLIVVNLVVSYRVKT